MIRAQEQKLPSEFKRLDGQEIVLRGSMGLRIASGIFALMFDAVALLCVWMMFANPSHSQTQFAMGLTALSYASIALLGCTPPVRVRRLSMCVGGRTA